MANNTTISKAHDELSRPLTRGYKRRHQELDFENAEFRKGKYISGLEEERRPVKARRIARSTTPAAAPSPATTTAIAIDQPSSPDTEAQRIYAATIQWSSTSEFREIRNLKRHISFLENVLQRSANKRDRLSSKIKDQIRLFEEGQEQDSPWTAFSSRNPDNEDELFELWDFSSVRISQWRSWIKVLQIGEGSVKDELKTKKARLAAMRINASVSVEEEQNMLEDPRCRALLERPALIFKEPACSITKESLNEDEDDPPASLHREPTFADCPAARASYKLLLRLNARLHRLLQGDWRSQGPIPTINDLEEGYNDIEDTLYELWLDNADRQTSHCGLPAEDVPTFLEQCHYMIIENLHSEILKIRNQAWSRYGMYTTAACKVVLLDDTNADLEPLEPYPIPESPPACFVLSREDKVPSYLRFLRCTPRHSRQRSTDSSTEEVC